MPRVLVCIGIVLMVLMTSLYWPVAAQTMGHPSVPTARSESGSDRRDPGRLVVHRPAPHPAILAGGQLLISLYVLIAAGATASVHSPGPRNSRGNGGG